MNPTTILLYGIGIGIAGTISFLAFVAFALVWATTPPEDGR